MGNSDHLFEILDTESLHRLAVMRQDRLERVCIAQLRMLRRERNDLVDGKGYLCVDRLLNPQSAVVSKVAMRSSSLTKSAEPSFAMRATKSIIAFFGSVLFHEGNGSCAQTPDATHEKIISATLMSFAFMAGCNR